MQLHLPVAVAAVLCVLVAAPAWAARPNLTEARAALAAGDLEQVVSLVEPIIASRSVNGETFFLMGEAQRGLGNLADAADAYESAIGKKYRVPAVYAGLAYTLTDLGRGAEVADLIEKPLSKAKDAKDQALLKHALGLAELAQGNFSKAQEWLLGARYDDLDNITYRVALGNAYYEGQVYPLAVAEYKAVLAADSSQVEILYRLADTYYQQRMLGKARPLLVELLKRDSSYHKAYFKLANINMIQAESRPAAEARKFYMQALSLYKRVRIVDPTASPVLVAKNIAKVYYLLNAHDSAAVELENAIQTGAEDPELHFFLGRSHMLLGHHAEAVEAFESYQVARESATPPVVWGKNDAELFRRTGSCLEALRDSTQWPKMAENFRRAVALDPDDEYSIDKLGNTLHRMGRYLEAAVEFEKRVVRHPNDSRVLFNASLPYLKTENNEKAVEYLLRAAENDTTSEGKYRLRGFKLAAPILIQMKMKRIQDARRAYQWLVEHESDVCDHRKWLGYTFFAERKYAAAAPHLRRAYRCFEQLAPQSCKHNILRWWLAYALYEAGEKDESYELCETVVDCDPSHANAGDARNLMDAIDDEIIEEN